QRVAAEDGPVIHDDMTGQGRVVDQDGVVADHAVVTDVHIGHQQVVVADARLATVLHGAAVNGHAFTNDIVITDLQPGRLPLVLQIGGILADTGELKNAVVAADP